jgi:cation-transporting ATPase 13A1
MVHPNPVWHTSRDTGLLLLFLLVFAVAASGYVLKKGMEDGTKSKYQLLLHCVLIITSVIPPELPMQMALAVSSALMTLMKMQIFCTEPFRVPLAGKVDVCLFDKTGTLTTDELVAVGVTDARGEGKAGGSGGQEAASLGLTGMKEAGPEATVVLGACHALVLVEGKVAGDPIEAAALKAIGWEVAEGQGQGQGQGRLTTRCRPSAAQQAARGGALVLGGVGRVACLEILARHHFSSKLQRMSVVARAIGPDGCPYRGALVLAKGSPEAVASLVRQGGLPVEFGRDTARLAKEGMRVLGMAFKVLPDEQAVAAACHSRADAEAGLEFGGLVAFTCRVRKDTAGVIEQLLEGRHSIAMVTGDALLTAVHVAKQVGICRKDRKGIRILAVRDGQVCWDSYETGERAEAFEAHAIPKLAGDFDLCTTGKALQAASAVAPETRRHLEHFVVYARMTPDEKEAVITSLKDCGHVCLMCGDGANDVGALKQAQVGVALLSGFGDLNVDRGEGAGPDGEGGGEGGTAIMTRAQLEELQRLRPSELKKKLRVLGVALEQHPQVVEKDDLIKLYQATMQRKVAAAHDRKNARDAKKGGPKTPQEARAEMERQRKEMMEKKREEFQREMEERTAKGESFAAVKAMMAIWQRDAEEARKKRQQMTQDASLTASAARMAAMMDEMDVGGEGGGNELPMVKIGDASVAAPFTSKMPSIRGTVDIIRQGRCTLVTTIQMYQILALTCLISSYSLSVLHFEGVKYGDYQMTVLGILMSVSYVTVSRSKPLDRLSGVRPFSSVFHPALFLSILGQFALHLVAMMLAVNASKKHLPSDYKPDPDAGFKPVIVNSVVFLVSAVQQVRLYSGALDVSPIQRFDVPVGR